MANTNLNILEIYNKTFGYVGAPYPEFASEGEINRFETNSFETTLNKVKGGFKFHSELGSEFMFPLVFVDKPNNEKWQLPVEPLISISGSNKIVETPLTRDERVVNVLEYINLNNYKISIKGILISNEADVYPEDDVKKLRNLLERASSHEVECPFLAFFEIKRIAVKSVSWPAVPGSLETQAYTMECVSDTSEELELTNEKDI